MVFVQGNHLHRSKMSFFLGLSGVLCYGIFHVLLLWVAHSPRVTISIVYKPIVLLKVGASCSLLKTNKEARLVERSMCVHAQLCPTLCDRMDCSTSGSSVYGIFQARILEWVAISFSRGSSRPRDQTHISCVSCISRWIIYH